MKLAKRMSGKAWPTSESAEDVYAVALKLSNGMTLTIRETEYGDGFVVSESTHFHLAVQPRAANAVEITAVNPQQFSIGNGVSE